MVVCPSTPIDAKGLLASALIGHDPVIFLEPKVLYRAGREDVPVEHYTLPIGGPGSEGRAPTSPWSHMGDGPRCSRSRRGLESSVEVIDLRTLFPWDRETVLDSVKKTGRLLLVQEPRDRQGSPPRSQPWSPKSRCTTSRARCARHRLRCPWPQFAIETHALIDVDRVVSGIKEAMAG